jgi:hypothetical protein
MTRRPRFPGWRTMTASERYNAKAAYIFETSWELKAKARGWAFDEAAKEYQLNDTGNGYDAVAPAHLGWRGLCLRFNIF